MFENALLIIKADYLHKRKQVLISLLEEGFQIQGRRRILFSPENAAEFYQSIAEEKNFMLQVILLSKGPSEAFILTKENAVSDLMNAMICYFNSTTAMESNVHVSKCSAGARREISYIFPNLINEPIPFFEKQKFCKNDLMAPLISELYNIHKSQEKIDWRIQLSEWLMTTNASIPIISNQCSTVPSSMYAQKSSQVNLIADKKDVCKSEKGYSSRSSKSDSSFGSSGLISSSSCISCSAFGSGTICPIPEKITSPEDILKARTKRVNVVEEIEEQSEEDVVRDLCGKVYFQPNSEMEFEANIGMEEAQEEGAPIKSDDEDYTKVVVAVNQKYDDAMPVDNRDDTEDSSKKLEEVFEQTDRIERTSTTSKTEISSRTSKTEISSRTSKIDKSDMNTTEGALVEGEGNTDTALTNTDAAADSA